MKYRNIQKIISLILLLGCAVLIFSCQKQGEGLNAQNPNAATGDLADAYKKFFAAVKSKDTEQIKAVMSKNSLGLAEFAAGQQKKPVDEVLKNGFTATTFADTLPNMRDERIKDDFGAIEVWNAQDKKWEDLPFIKEDGAWKFAVGDMFKGSYQSPGKPMSVKEQEAANAANPNLVPAPAPANMNSAVNMNPNANVTVIKPKLDNRNMNK
jgi:hypothetical protein